MSHALGDGVGASAGDGVFVIAFEWGVFDDDGSLAGGEVGEDGFAGGGAVDGHPCSDIDGEVASW